MNGKAYGGAAARKDTCHGLVFENRWLCLRIEGTSSGTRRLIARLPATFMELAMNISSSTDLSALLHTHGKFHSLHKAEAQESSPANAFQNYEEIPRTKRSTPIADPEPRVIEFRHVPVRLAFFSDKLRKDLDRIIDEIKSKDVAKIEITGYVLFFRDFAIQRAKTVKEYFVEHGVDANLISIYGHIDPPPDTSSGSVIVHIIEIPQQQESPAVSMWHKLI
jgi:hypothetical protein